MNCRKIEEHLLKNPGALLSRELQEHLTRCRACSELWREQSALNDVLRSFPQAELPAYLGTRALARLEGRHTVSGKRMLEPGWLTLAAPAMALIVAFSALVMRYEYGSRYINTPDRPAIVQDPISNNNTIPETVQNLLSENNSQIYPVWPADQDVIGRDDLTIMASLYPDNPGRARILLDDIDVSSWATIDRQHISYDPGSLEAGEHVVKVILQQANGSYHTASWSFYLLEERS